MAPCIKNYISSEEQLNNIIESIELSDVYALKLMPINNKDRLEILYFDDQQDNHFIYSSNFEVLPEEVKQQTEVFIEDQSYLIKSLEGNIFLTPSGYKGGSIKTEE